MFAFVLSLELVIKTGCKARIRKRGILTVPVTKMPAATWHPFVTESNVGGWGGGSRSKPIAIDRQSTCCVHWVGHHVMGDEARRPCEMALSTFSTTAGRSCSTRGLGSFLQHVFRRILLCGARVGRVPDLSFSLSQPVTSERCRRSRAWVGFSADSRYFSLAIGLVESHSLRNGGTTLHCGLWEWVRDMSLTQLNG